MKRQVLELIHLQMLGLLAILLLARPLQAQEMTLVDGGQALANIIVAPNASAQLGEAANELRKHLGKITGVSFAVESVDNAAPSNRSEIVLGARAAMNRCRLDIRKEALGDQGYIIRTLGNRLVIAGETDLGTLYGVYGFLEDHLGVRWFTPDVTKIPRQLTLAIGRLNERFAPAFESRMLLWANSRRSIPWSSRMKVNCFIHSYGIHIREFVAAPILKGLYHFTGGHVHTISDLLPINKYFDEHPEYFSEIDGIRLKNQTQPCLTNPEVARIITKNAMRQAAIASQRPHGIISITQNDWANPCRCSNCIAAYKKKGLDQTYVEFVNEIAKRVEKEYPGVLVETLAYSWTRQPPKGLQLNSNMLIRYAALSQCRRHGYDCEHSGSEHAKEWLEKWIAASPRVWVWYYSGGQSLVPWNNLESFAADFRHFAEVGAKGVFLEGTSRHYALDFGELKAYLLAKLSWNPHLDDQAIIREYIDYCYGPAAPVIREFIAIINDDRSYLYPQKSSMKGQGHHLTAGLLKREAVQKMFDVCQRAEKLAAGDKQLVARIKIIRLSCDYLSILYLSKDDPRRATAVQNFFSTAKATGLSEIYSQDMDGAPWKSARYASLEEFRQAVDGTAALNYIEKQMRERFEPFYGGKLLDTTNLDTGSGPGWFKIPLHQEGDVTATSGGMLIGNNAYVVYPGTRLGSFRFTPFTIELDIKISSSSGEQTLFLTGGGTDHEVTDPETIEIRLTEQRVKVLIRSYQSGVDEGFASKSVITDQIPGLYGHWRRLAVTYQNDASAESMPRVFMDSHLIPASPLEKRGHARITERLGWWKLGSGGFASADEARRFTLDPYYTVWADATYDAVSNSAPGLYRNVFFRNFIGMSTK